ncbi:hypothetical protein BCV70DRAFT_197668 [Testicularia cyperi]|uniref:Uncharacterized protein n=1 Tax=Testicularia cyperi TaxID=1882483 RepID=A0A317XYT7_9BASI|nr:hypothetical protein BCV70DRAFT_197668 [Testicularia cyperi]
MRVFALVLALLFLIQQVSCIDQTESSRRGTDGPLEAIPSPNDEEFRPKHDGAEARILKQKQSMLALIDRMTKPHGYRDDQIELTTFDSLHEFDRNLLAAHLGTDYRNLLVFDMGHNTFLDWQSVFVPIKTTDDAGRERFRNGGLLAVSFKNGYPPTIHGVITAPRNPFIVSRIIDKAKTTLGSLGIKKSQLAKLALLPGHPDYVNVLQGGERGFEWKGKLPVFRPP